MIRIDAPRQAVGGQCVLSVLKLPDDLKPVAEAVLLYGLQRDGVLRGGGDVAIPLISRGTQEPLRSDIAHNPAAATNVDDLTRFRYCRNTHLPHLSLANITRVRQA
jgi:hypothetical protein